MAALSAGRSPCVSSCHGLQAALTKPIVVYQGDTDEVLTKFEPGTREADMWQHLVTPSIRGRLEDSNGICVIQSTT